MVKKVRKEREPSYEYICRRLVSKNRTGDVYGLTIPAKLVKEYKLLGKKFKIKVDKRGLFVMKIVITYKEMDDEI